LKNPGWIIRNINYWALDNIMATANLLHEDIEQKINQLISQMSLDEKIGQTNQLNTFGEIEKEGVRKGQIGSILNATSAFTGVGSSPSASAEICNAIQHIAITESKLKIPLLFGRDVIHGYRTVFPIPLGQAASWNADLVEIASSIAAHEATTNGIKWTFAPMVDISRDPRWGRVAESSGEDPYLASTLSEAAVRGFQGTDLSQATKMVACAKHFVGYGAAEGGRDYESSEISLRTLRDIYLPSYQAAVNAGVGTIMAGFHDLSGVPMSAHRQLLTDVLRLEWGFKGFVVSDWASIEELVNHGIAQDRMHAASLALFAGVDMDMVSGTYSENLSNLVEQGSVKLETLEEAVRRILRIKYLAGLFNQPYTDPRRAATTILSDENRNIARLLAQQSVVLLKNEAEILPLDSRFKRIAILGPHIHSQRELLGTWSPDGRPEETMTIADAIKELKPKDIELFFAEASDEAIRISKQVDVAVVVLGEHPIRSGENSNVSDLRLPPGQSELLESIWAQDVPIILVILAGRPLAIQKELRFANAIFYAWHPGTEGAHAIADLLFGLANPSGKLPITMPRVTGQVPIYYNHKNSGRPIGSSHFAYRYVDIPQGPLFPFGFGMSYTTFKYGNLSVSASADSGPYNIEADITNTGKRSGSEVVQLYIQDRFATVTRPVKELKRFQRIFLKPGETQHISFIIKPADLTFTGLDNLAILEPGEFSCWLGPNSVEGLEGSFALEL
jgi:beta-glucosidase